MTAFVVGAVGGLVCYGMGFYIGRLYGHEDIRKQREEMGIDEEPNEQDEWDKIWKG